MHRSECEGIAGRCIETCREKKFLWQSISRMKGTLNLKETSSMQRKECESIIGCCNKTMEEKNVMAEYVYQNMGFTL
jgi:hypothetical protein